MLRVFQSCLFGDGGLVVLITRGVVRVASEVASMLLSMMDELLMEGVVLALGRQGEIVSGDGVCERESARG